MGLRLALSRGRRPGIFEGVPVTKTFCNVTLSKTIDRECRGEQIRTLTSRAFSASVKRARVVCRTSPKPAESTPAILGENQVSGTLQRSTFK